MTKFDFIAFAVCRPKILLENSSFTSISRGFSRTCIPPPVCGIIKDIIIQFAEAFRYSYHHHQYITHLPLRFQDLGASIFQEHLLVAVSAYTCLNVTSKKTQVI